MLAQLVIARTRQICDTMLERTSVLSIKVRPRAHKMRAVKCERERKFTQSANGESRNSSWIHVGETIAATFLQLKPVPSSSLLFTPTAACFGGQCSQAGWVLSLARGCTAALRARALPGCLKAELQRGAPVWTLTCSATR